MVWIGILFVGLLAVSCDELKAPLPAAPDPMPPPAASDFSIQGHWEAKSTQGRSITFNVTEIGRVKNGRIKLHHDCASGRWRVTFRGFEAKVVDNAFITTVDWELVNEGNGLTRAGSYTISGRFESNNVVRGAVINSVNDIRRFEQPTGDFCTTTQVFFEGAKEE